MRPGNVAVDLEEDELDASAARAVHEAVASSLLEQLDAAERAGRAADPEATVESVALAATGEPAGSARGEPKLEGSLQMGGVSDCLSAGTRLLASAPALAELAKAYLDNSGTLWDRSETNVVAVIRSEKHTLPISAARRIAAAGAAYNDAATKELAISRTMFTGASR